MNYEQPETTDIPECDCPDCNYSPEYDFTEIDQIETQTITTNENQT